MHIERFFCFTNKFVHLFKLWLLNNSDDIIVLCAIFIQIIGTFVIGGSVFPVSGISVGDGLGHSANLTAYNPEAAWLGLFILILGFITQALPNLDRLLRNPAKNKFKGQK